MIFKMNRVTTLLIAVFLGVSEVAAEDPITGKVTQLTTLINYSKKHGENSHENKWDTKEHAKAYFHEFPEEFNEFTRIFDLGGPLYDGGGRYIFLFFETAKIVDIDLFVDKSLDVAAGGYWSADNVSLYQHELIKTAKERKNDYARVMADYDIKKITSILRFLVDNPHNPNKVGWLIDEICDVVNKGKSFYKVRSFCATPGEFEKSLFPKEHFGHG